MDDGRWTAGQIAACVLGAIICAALVIAAGLWNPEQHVSASVDATKAAGQPLDASNVTEYARPIWLPECERAYRVTDRQTGACWWLLKMDEGWVSLPIGDEQ